MNIALHLPINRLSFGQVSTLILRQLYERELAGQKNEIYLFPIGQLDLSCQNKDDAFQEWVKGKILHGLEQYSRDIPVFKLWHLNGSLESFGKEQILLTFHELDDTTVIERNIAKNNRTIFSSNFSREVFKNAGIETGYLPLAFDSYNFFRTQRPAILDDRITFNLCGKWEKRKNHQKVLQAWMKKYGNDSRYALNCAVYNPFLNEEQNRQVVVAAINGKKPFNVNFFPMMSENSVYNEFLNSADIILGMSGGEGFGLPEFQSVALGKHAVMLKAHAYPTWASDDMVTWVNPSPTKIEAYDGIFFNKGQPFNQGNIFDFNEDEFIAACETAISKVNKSRINGAGLTLQETFTKERFVDGILKELGK